MHLETLLNFTIFPRTKCKKIPFSEKENDNFSCRVGMTKGKNAMATIVYRNLMKVVYLNCFTIVDNIEINRNMNEILFYDN